MTASKLILYLKNLFLYLFNYTDDENLIGVCKHMLVKHFKESFWNIILILCKYIISSQELLYTEKMNIHGSNSISYRVLVYIYKSLSKQISYNLNDINKDLI